MIKKLIWFFFCNSYLQLIVQQSKKWTFSFFGDSYQQFILQQSKKLSKKYCTKMHRVFWSLSRWFRDNKIANRTFDLHLINTLLYTWQAQSILHVQRMLFLDFLLLITKLQLLFAWFLLRLLSKSFYSSLSLICDVRLTWLQFSQQLIIFQKCFIKSKNMT